MEEYIRKIIETQNHTLEELINCFEMIKTKGEVAVIKFDGERDKEQYTVFISFPKNNREMIRADENTLKDACKIVLLEYLKNI